MTYLGLAASLFTPKKIDELQVIRELGLEKYILPSESQITDKITLAFTDKKITIDEYMKYIQRTDTSSPIVDFIVDGICNTVNYCKDKSDSIRNKL